MALNDLLAYLNVYLSSPQYHPIHLLIGAFFVAIPSFSRWILGIDPTFTLVPEGRERWVPLLRFLFAAGMVYGWILTYVGVIPLVAYAQGQPVGDWVTSILFLLAGAILVSIGTYYLSWAPFVAIALGGYGTGQVFGWLSASPPLVAWGATAVSMILLLFIFLKFVEDIQRTLGAVMVHLIKPLPAFIGLLLVLQWTMLGLGQGIGPYVEALVSSTYTRWFGGGI